MAWLKLLLYFMKSSHAGPPLFSGADMTHVFFIKVFSSLIVIILALSFLLVYTSSHPPRYPLDVPPSDFGLRFEKVSFLTGDGIEIKGWFVPASGAGKKAPAIILCHGLGAGKSDFTAMAGPLSERGLHVLLFDFRGHGESGGGRSSFGHEEIEDIRAAIDHLKGRGEVDAERIGIYGFSMGGAAAIMAAAENEDIKALVADSSYTDLKEQGLRFLEGAYGPIMRPLIHPMMWIYRFCFNTDPGGISPVNSISGISPRPVLIIGGKEDEQMPSSDAQRLYGAAGEPKSLWLIPGAVHGGTLYSAGEKYHEKVGDFFCVIPFN